jgi:hypothetical protein
MPGRLLSRALLALSSFALGCQPAVDELNQPLATGASQEDTPPGIPVDYVRTPAGWTHKSCVHEVPNGATVKGGDVFVSGRLIAHYERCGFEFIDVLNRPSEGARTSAAPPPPNSNGYLEYTFQNLPAGRRLSSVQSIMTVPQAPEAGTPQTNYYFSGVQSTVDLANDCGILQPVLQWGKKDAIGGTFWSIASWWVKRDMTYKVSVTNPTVSTGQGVTGSITYSTMSNSWTIDARVPTGGAATLNAAIPATTCRFNQLIGAALESYNASSCSQISKNRIDFTGIVFKDDLNATLTYAPSLQVPLMGPAPPCGWGVGTVGLPATFGQSTSLWSSIAWQGDAQPTGCGIITAGRGLVMGRSFSSCDGRFTLWMQEDGNLVLYWAGHGSIWASNTSGSSGRLATMQTDGNFVVYDGNFATAPWSSGSFNHPNSVFEITNDGNLVVRTGSFVWWQSFSGGH